MRQEADRRPAAHLAMTAPPRRGRATEGLGRRHGKTLRPLPTAALAEVLPGYRLDLASPAPQELDAFFCAGVRGAAGDRLRLRRASAPRGHAPARRRLHRRRALRQRHGDDDAGAKTGLLANLRVHDDDATQLLDWLPAASLTRIDLLYPDPWPKKKHWKRRFGECGQPRPLRARPEARRNFPLHFDIDHYVNWTLLACRAHGAFAWQAAEARDWHQAYEAAWLSTRYEAKALREGRRASLPDVRQGLIVAAGPG